MHRGAMVVPCRTRGALRSAGPGGMLACARHHVLVPVRPVGGRVPFRVGEAASGPGGKTSSSRFRMVFPRRNRWDRRHADDLTIREVCFTM